MIVNPNKIAQFNQYVNFVGTSQAIPPINKTFIIGHRNLDANGNYYPLEPINGQTAQLTAYTEYVLNDCNSAAVAVAQMIDLGFRATYGLSGVLEFSAPDEAVLNADGTATLTWNNAPTGFYLLREAGIQLLISQSVSNANGTVIYVSNNTYSIIVEPTDVSGEFNTTNVITINWVASGTGILDPNNTDEIVMNVYYIFQGMNGVELPSANNQVTNPPISISFLNPQDNGDAPNPNPINIGIPSSVVLLENGNYGIYYSIVPSNFGYVPNQQIGNSTLNQGEAVGLVIGYLNGLVPDGIGVEVKVTAGAFTADSTINLILDATATVYNVDNLQAKVAVFCYAINNDEDLNNPLYANYFNWLRYQNSPQGIGAAGIVGITPTVSARDAVLTQPNDEYLCRVWYKYIQTLGLPSLSAGNIACMMAAILIKNGLPYNAVTGAACVGLPVSASEQNRGNQYEGNLCLSNGVSAILVNGSGGAYSPLANSGQAFVYRAVNTQPNISSFDNAVGLEDIFKDRIFKSSNTRTRTVEISVPQEKVSLRTIKQIKKTIKAVNALSATGQTNIPNEWYEMETTFAIMYIREIVNNAVRSWSGLNTRGGNSQYVQSFLLNNIQSNSKQLAIDANGQLNPIGFLLNVDYWCAKNYIVQSTVVGKLNLITYFQIGAIIIDVTTYINIMSSNIVPTTVG